MNGAPMKTVLFVCLHGAAKSVLAAADFERLARALAEGVDLCGQRPRRVTRDDVAGAWRVVTFGCALEELGAGAPVERWDDVPAVSDDFRKARAAIEARVGRLLDELS